MPKIQFDVLVPRPQRERVEEIFRTALDKLIVTGEVGSYDECRDDEPQVTAQFEEQLRQTYRDEHAEHELEDAAVTRYLLVVEGLTGSVNQLAMVLSRLLTPRAAWPKNHVLLEDERAHELPAIFPWALEIYR